MIRHGPIAQIRQQIPCSPNLQCGVWFFTRNCHASAPTFAPVSNSLLVAASNSSTVVNLNSLIIDLLLTIHDLTCIFLFFLFLCNNLTDRTHPPPWVIFKLIKSAFSSTNALAASFDSKGLFYRFKFLIISFSATFTGLSSGRDAVGRPSQSYS